ncbi:hypothetical protein H6CHR_04288 [Variovorax sp. PBL-H6]|uniref:thrombospondin type 3 repeat-containing protein n=1 Tax=Variovorax sp. PBL-H6 TaxID=434009 RepID=UPI001317BB7F|nr:thrombospondin type 3 repeat-containing protein [Variovorax sp. PBL-H6]VTU34810.1 hypothetical protein H6CHR_04288 [Variovorax sp. PBL-H6]
MKKISFAVGAAALLSLGAFATAPAHAHDGRYGYDNRVIVVPAPPPPPRAYYAPPPRHYDDRRYYHRERGWRDNDRDGVPNRYDRDRDGDGVPNYYDRRPNNPYRY